MIRTDNEVSNFEMLHAKAITCVAVSSDGLYIVTGSSDMTVRLWQYVSNSKNVTIPSTSSPVIVNHTRTDLVLQVRAMH